MKTFEQPNIELAQNLVYEKATVIDNEYRLDIPEIDAAEKLQFFSKFNTVANDKNHASLFLGCYINY